MTVLSFDKDGVEVVYEGSEFRLERDFVEEAIGKSYPDITDHEVLKIIEKNPSFNGPARRIGDILRK